MDVSTKQYLQCLVLRQNSMVCPDGHNTAPGGKTCYHFTKTVAGSIRLLVHCLALRQKANLKGQNLLGDAVVGDCLTV